MIDPPIPFVRRFWALSRWRPSAESRSKTSVAPVSAAATTAEAPAVHAPAGPASFADVVDRVKPAVVSVKVKLTDADQVDDEDSDGMPGMPDIPKNSPFYHFFRHFGMPDGNNGG